MLKFVLWNILFVALPLAIFEIIIEKDKGWGSGWDPTKWYARPFLSGNKTFGALARLIQIQQPLNYHFVIFGLIMPVIFFAEYVFFTTNPFLLLAAFLTVLISEDFLWFLLNWNFDSLTQLLKGPKGSIWWHKSWVRVGSSVYLPTVYFTSTAVVLILLWLA